MKEPAEPDAFAFACFADPVHAVVPVSRSNQRQAVAADRKTGIERARAVFEQRAVLFGDRRLKVRFMLAVVRERGHRETEPSRRERRGRR